MAEAIANDDADLAVRAQYWYQDYEACLEREAQNPSTPPSGGSSSGSSGGSSWTPTRPTYVPPPSHPSCGSVEQPIPRGRQTGPNTVTFDWDLNSQAKDYRINIRKTQSGMWQDWSGYSSIGRATSHTVSLESGGSVMFNLLIMCSGSSDGYIYPKGTLRVAHAPVTYAHSPLGASWICSAPATSQFQTCTKTWTVNKKKSKKARRTINGILDTAMTDLVTQQVAPHGPFSVDARRVGRGNLQVTVNAKIAGSQRPYAEGQFYAS